eukprot:TRINITY_DN27284_c0_g1_i1.p1 TRINITY_DN27284_c0_g1~~TRINITY_DN27284_c0_g1_i1.p1  ORF type:complete len:444 (+),score=97.23 TRINITY_DN27284_c0_g1_i1:115-1446(+)
MIPRGSGPGEGVLELEYVRSTADLQAALAPVMADGGAVGVDCEFPQGGLPRLALLQLLVGRVVYLVLPEAVTSWEPLRAAFADRRTCWIFHACGVDAAVLREDVGAVPAVLFDTQVAAQFLGYPALSYERAVGELLEVPLMKDSKTTTSSWGRRPLTRRQEDYAARDVAYLPDLAERLLPALAAHGRAAWAWEECALLAHTAAARHARFADGADPALMLDGFPAHALTPRALRFLCHALPWRERVCRRLRVGRAAVAADKTLKTLAAALDRANTPAPDSLFDLIHLCPELDFAHPPATGTKAEIEDLRAEGLLDALRSTARDGADEPFAAALPPGPVNKQLAAAVDAARAAVAARAAELSLSATFLASARLVEDVAAGYAEAIRSGGPWVLPERMTAWRRDVLVPALRPALEMHTALILKCPYVRYTSKARAAVQASTRVPVT